MIPTAQPMTPLPLNRTCNALIAVQYENVRIEDLLINQLLNPIQRLRDAHLTRLPRRQRREQLSVRYGASFAFRISSVR